MTTSPPSLRELQKKALLKLLNLNQEEEKDELVPNVTNGEPVWKFLVFDKLGQDVISSVLRVSDLREAGVTVHMQLKADRQQMEDVPASMFLMNFLIRLRCGAHRRECQPHRGRSSTKTL